MKQNLTLLLLLLSVPSSEAEDESCSVDNSCTDNSPSNRQPCSLYLAPSSLPNAGVGLYSGRKIPEEWSVHEYASYCEEEDDDVSMDESTMWTDPFVTVWNRNNRPFASWMGYVWPSSPGEWWNGNNELDGYDEGLAFAKDIYQCEDGRRGPREDAGMLSPVSVVALGVASLANSHPKLANIERNTERFEIFKQDENHKATLDPSLTHFPGRVVDMVAPFDAGMAAIAPSYGNDFVTTRKVKVGSELLMNYGNKWHRRADKRVSGEEEELMPRDIVKSLDWLNENGVCLFDSTLTSFSSMIPYAARGAFTTRSVKKGEVLSISPLLAISRDDLKVSNSYNGGNQIMINYSFGHKHSSLLIVPMAPVVGYINHSTKSNTAIRWPKPNTNAAKLYGNNDWLDMSLDEVLKRSGKFAMEYVATQDIQQGGEILIDYGTGWDESWKDFMKMHPYERPGYFRRELSVSDGFYPEKWLDMV